MSRFLTTIDVDVQAVLEVLPPRAHPLDVRFNPETCQVEIEWDDDDLVTPWSFAHEYPLELLRARKLPVQTAPRRNLTPAASRKGRKFLLAKAKPQELPGGPTTEIVRAPLARGDGAGTASPELGSTVPTPAPAAVDRPRGGRGNG